MKIKENVAGRRFGRLITVKVSRLGKYKEQLWECRCDCGGSTVARIYALKNSNTRSCGCLQKETAREGKLTHGLSYTPAYRSNQSRKTRYGLTADDIEAIKETQQGKCSGCLRDLLGSKFHVDHDHTTGKVRGLLCRGCNLSLGLLHDDPDTLERLAKYLRSAKLSI